jgi:2-keto-4-pentenoate hydratase/2-oxohepta-3-ene-1,7-dioic acid hydratase in catechol pathway
MRFCRFDGDRLGVVLDGELADVSEVLDHVPSKRWPDLAGDPLIARLDHLRAPIESLLGRAPRRPLSEVRLESPVPRPGKVIAAPVNYLAHLEEVRADPEIHRQRRIAEIREAGLFLKASSSVVGPAEGPRVPFPDRRTDHEIELAVVIGRQARNLSVEEALACVAGYTIGLDMTVRGPEERSLRKSFDGATVLGPWLVTAEEIPDPQDLVLELRCDGELRQQAGTREMIMSVRELVAFASQWYTLEPGDVLLTGTPAGVGPVRPGSHLEARISRIGTLHTVVRGDGTDGAGA